MHQGHRKVSKRSYFSESSEICLQGKTMHEYAIAKEKIDKSLLWRWPRAIQGCTLEGQSK